MKLLKLLLFISLCLNGWAAQAKCSQYSAKDIGLVQRFTDVSGGQVRWEIGTLFVKQGFIPSGGGVYSASQFSLTPDVLAQINGQLITELSRWVGLEGVPAPGGNYLCNFSRSALTYSVDNAPYVIVSVKQATVKKPKVSISAIDPTASETAGDPAQFLITLNAPSARNIRVKLQVSGKAKKNKDYTGIPKSVLVPSGNVSAIVEILPIDDAVAEGAEDVQLKVSSGGDTYSALGGNRGRASITINDND